jgi:hypothetical protein
MSETSLDSCLQVFHVSGKTGFVWLNRDNQWGFERDGEFHRFATPTSCMFLLPLLQSSYPENVAVIRTGMRNVGMDDDGLVTSFPFDAIVICALTWEDSYWPLLAVQWLENGYPLSDPITIALRHIPEDKRYSQNLRHRAKHLIKKYSMVGHP